MKPRHDNFFKIIQMYNPTQNLILFHVLYSESKSDKYNPSKLHSSLSSLTPTISDFAHRQVQHLAGAFLTRVLTIM
jgi:hypothetical protein